MNSKYFIPFFFIAHIIGFHCAIGQNITRDTVKIDDQECVYFTARPNEKINGIVLILPGRGENPKEVFKSTNLPKALTAKGYLTVIPVLRYSLFAGKAIRAQIAQILNAQSIKYKLNNPD
jgi:hypothetical protein